MDENEQLKKSIVTHSGRSSIIKGAKFHRGLVILPAQILSLLADNCPNLPIPEDFNYRGFDLKGGVGVDCAIVFHFFSLSNPHVHEIRMKPELLFNFIKSFSDGNLPLDAELDGFEADPNWLYLMVRVKSSHWPPAETDALPIYNFRYEFGQVGLYHPSRLIQDRKIKLTDNWKN